MKKESKRQRVVKQQVEVPDSWVQKGTRVLDSINKQKFSQWFREPVRPTATFVPDYFSIVKAPMDLGTAREKLRTGQYETSLAFAKVRRTHPRNRSAAHLHCRSAAVACLHEWRPWQVRAWRLQTVACLCRT